MFQNLDDWLNMAKHQAQAQEQTLVFVEKVRWVGSSGKLREVRDDFHTGDCLLGFHARLLS